VGAMSGGPKRSWAICPCGANYGETQAQMYPTISSRATRVAMSSSIEMATQEPCQCFWC